MKNKKLLLGTMGVAVIGGVSTLIPFGVYAAENPEEVNTFVQKLAEKLGIDEATVETAVESVHTEIRSEHEVEREAAITQAVTDGTLTERQGEILAALYEAFETIRPKDRGLLERQNWSELTEEERQAHFGEMKDERDQKLVDALNEQGLNTTLEELESTREAARSANLDFDPRMSRHGGVPPMMR